MYDFSKIFEPKNVAEAVQMLTDNKDSVVLAGGSDVLIKAREGKLAGAAVVSIYKLDELRGVKMDTDGTIVIGPLTSFDDIEHNEIIRKYVPVLAEAVGQVGGPQVRNIGTIGGNICNGVTSADSASTLLALDAVLEVTSVSGKRDLPITEFYVSAGKVALAGGELLTAIKLPKTTYENCFGKYIKYAMRAAMDIATLNCSLNIKIADGKIERLRLAYGVAAPVPIRACGTETFAIGMSATPGSAEQIAKNAVSELKPRTSWRASAELRRQVANEITKRAFLAALEMAGIL